MRTRLLAVVPLSLALAAAAAAPPKPEALLPPVPAAVAEAGRLRSQGQEASAAALLEEALPAAPEGERDAVALALAEALRAGGDPERAAQVLEACAAGPSALAPYARFARARALSEAGRPGEALPLLSPPKASTATPRLQEEALRLLAACALAAGKPAEALPAWEALEKARPGARAECRFRRGEALLAAGRKTEARAVLASLWKEETGSPWGRRAGQLLKRAFPEFAPLPASAPEALPLAKALLSGGRAEDAWDLLEALGARKLPPPEAGRVAFLKAQALYALRWNADLQTFADAAWAAAPDSEAGLYATSRALWACLRTDDVARAEALAARLLASPKAEPELQADTRYALGSLYFCRGDWARARGALDALDAMALKDGARTAGLYKAAWAARKSGDAAGARERMARLAASAPSTYADPARYYLSLWLEEAGQTYLARAGWESLALGPGYWATAAREALAARGKGLPPRTPPALPAAGADAATPSARLAEILAAAGLDTFAAEAYEPHFSKERRDPSVRLRFAQLLARAGETGRAYSLARADYGDPERLDALPPALAEVFYPRPFEERLAGADGRVPRGLVYAITKRESGFDPDVLSPAGAVGLMQLMPETAAKLPLGGETLPTEADLLDPATNLRLGAAYLVRLEELLGSRSACVAAYNAGEEKVAQWLAAFVPADETEFVAMVPYEETRLYTQRVLADFAKYQAQSAPPPAPAPGG